MQSHAFAHVTYDAQLPPVPLLPKHAVACPLQCACSQLLQAVSVVAVPVPAHLKGLLTPPGLPPLVELLLHAAMSAPPSTTTVTTFQGLNNGILSLRACRDVLSRTRR